MLNLKLLRKKKKNYTIKDALIKIISSPNFSSKKWIYNQYDRSVMGDTIYSSESSDAAVVRIHKTNKAVAITCDCNPIYCQSDPKLGAAIAVAESWRNLISSGAKPIAITDNLNYGNPEKKEIMFQIKEGIKGIKLASEKLNYPVVSGNVSLYNETNKKSILPTPVIGGVGLIKDISLAKGLKINSGDSIFLIGESTGHMELSEFNRICNISNGQPPKLNLDIELKNGLFIQKIIKNHSKIITGCHDISDGGIIISLAELCIQNVKGIKIFIPKKIKKQKEWLFCEDQSRYLLIVNNDDILQEFAISHNIEINKVGEVYGESFTLKNQFEIPVKRLIKYNSNWFERYTK